MKKISRQWTDFVIRSLPGSENISFQTLYGDGSSRTFYRVKGACRPSVLMVNPDPPADSRTGVNENDTYVYLAGLLEEIASGCPPSIYGYDRKAGLILVEDLGHRHLQSEVLCLGVGSDWTENIYSRLLQLLVKVQVEGGARFDPSRSFNPAYDEAFMYEAEGLYFARFFIGCLCGITEPALDNDLKRLARKAGGLIGDNVLVYRDFQSRNIMLGAGVKKETFRLLDFQGARLGPPAYDLASLVYDPYLPLPQALRDKLISRYVKLLAERSKALAGEFEAQFPFIASHRLMQVLGAYAKLSLVHGKKKFLEYVPRALGDFKALLEDNEFRDYSVLKQLTRQVDLKGLKLQQPE